MITPPTPPFVRPPASMVFAVLRKEMRDEYPLGFFARAPCGASGDRWSLLYQIKRGKIYGRAYLPLA